MSFGTALAILKELIVFLQTNGLLLPDGTFKAMTPDDYAGLAAGVESILKTHGVAVPAELDKIVEALPSLLKLLGV